MTPEEAARYQTLVSAQSAVFDKPGAAVKFTAVQISQMLV